MKKLLSGNEALALGAYHAGVRVAAAYPGTPSTEILEALAGYPGIYTEWSTNEKVALEVALGAALGGVRAMSSMKHVGLNVAADPFFGASVTGIQGGLVVVSADDPGMHSSQNEQDNRHYARFAKVPMLEPSDSQEAYDLIILAFALSEEFDTPVLFRTTTRISHCKTVVEAPDNLAPKVGEARFVRNPSKYVMVPGYARPRHRAMEERMERLAAYSEVFQYNRVIPGEPKLGIVASGVAFQYAREVFSDASFLKLTMTYPLPAELVRRFASSVERVIVVEELDPFLEDSIRALGIPVEGKSLFPIVGELSTEVVEEGGRKGGLLPPAPTPWGRGWRQDSVQVAVEVGCLPTEVGATATQRRLQSADPAGQGKCDAQPGDGAAASLPLRPPVLCPGCPHSACSFALRRLGFYRSMPTSGQADGGKLPGSMRPSGLIVTSDIGCYTLAVYQPLLALDTCVCMGASIGMALGMEKAGIQNTVVAVIGDSTFLHTGIPALVDVVYNQGRTTVIILDNETTAMTGHQGHPGMGVNARGQKTTKVCLEDLCRGIGIKDVHVVDAFDMEQVSATIQGCVARDEPSVIIVRGDCPLHVRAPGEPFAVRQEDCDGCNTCLRVGCPALVRVGNKVTIDPTMCVGGNCDVCAQVCPREAIVLGSQIEARVQGPGSRVGLMESEELVGGCPRDVGVDVPRPEEKE
ncbi:MAG: thiamine pyrophosphate-dependent enzyme [Dehalococcoidia bacterium]|nr:thiamine pyrophosphate-dependent enzyme [Dehalococcoidia bacterium]